MTSEDPAQEDPFFGVVREHHPDVDFVLLPPVVLPPDEQDPEVENHARESVGDIRETTERLVDSAGLPSMTSQMFWSDSSATGSRQWIARAWARPVSTERGVPALRAVGNTLLELGWDARPYADGSPRLEAAKGELACSAELSNDVLMVDLVSPPYALTEETARALEDGQ